MVSARRSLSSCRVFRSELPLPSLPGSNLTILLRRLKILGVPDWMDMASTSNPSEAAHGSLNNEEPLLVRNFSTYQASPASKIGESAETAKSVALDATADRSDRSPQMTLDIDSWQTNYFESQINLGDTLEGDAGGWQIAESRKSRRNRGIRNGDSIAPAETSHDHRISAAPASNSRSRFLPTRPQSHASRTLSSGSDYRRVQQSRRSFAAVDLTEMSPDGSLASTSFEKKRRRKRSKNGTTSQDPKHATVNTTETDLYRLEATHSEHLASHRDERQVELDIQRSFAGFSTGPLSLSKVKGARRRQLQDLVVGVLRRHPKLHYYQGYHDVMSVLLLVLCPDDPHPSDIWNSGAEFSAVLKSAERLSVFYLRDFMAPKIEPCLGWLKVIRNCIRRVDSDYAHNIVERAGSLPFFALSWLITLMSHELDIEGDLVQRVFDAVLTEGPQAIAWILAALVSMGSKDLCAASPGHGEEGDNKEGDAGDADMLHHSLSKLPKTLRRRYKEETTNGRQPRGEDILNRVLESAQKVKGACLDGTNQEGTAAPPPWKGVMGSQSMLCTWSPACAEEEWKRREDAIEQGLLLASDDAGDVVLDPYPTPSTSEAGNLYDDIIAKNGKEQVSRRHSNDKPPAAPSRKALETSGTALFVGVFVVAGAAVALFTSRPVGTEVPPSMKMLHDLSRLGRDFLRLALAAGK